MDVKRRIKNNKIINDIKDAELSLQRSKDTIKRLKNSQMGEVYVKAQIVKLQESIVSKEILVEELTKTQQTLLTGDLDYEIEQEYKDTEEIIKTQNIETAKKKIQKKEETEENKNISKQYWESTMSDSRSQKQKEKDIKYGYSYYRKVCDALPSYISKNLSEMPNNKGYIWRGVYFYGELEDEKGPCVMFEKQKGSLLIIHEYTSTEYKRYEKDGKNKKQLVYKEMRKQKDMGPNIMDYLVKN